MKQQQMADGRVLNFDQAMPGYVSQPAEDSRSQRRWYIRAGLWIGVLMADPRRDPPNDWKITPAVVTLLLVIGGLVASGAWYLGYQAKTIEIIERQAESAAQSAKVAVQTVSGATDEDPTPTPTPKRK